MNNEWAPYDDEQSAEVAYENFLNGSYPAVEVAGHVFDPAAVIAEMDPVGYRTGFNDWLDSESR